MKKRFLIETYHRVHLDTFADGELGQVNHYHLSEIISAETAKEAIQKYFDNFCYSLKIDELKFEDDNDFLSWSVMVDRDNIEASETEIEEWKEEKLKLYSNNINIYISEIIKINKNENL